MKRWMLISGTLSICWSEASNSFLVEDSEPQPWNGTNDPELGRFPTFDEAMSFIMQDMDATISFEVRANPYCGE